ncbi:MAG: polysaccharide biosynthesis protein [Prevotella sp.]|nr:polysaccharide biosynthesis protein [Prevotella sp.]
MNILLKLKNWYFSKRALPYWGIFLIDLAIIFVSAFIVYWSVHRGMQTLLHSYALSRVLLIYLLVSAVTFRIFHTYSGIIRYTSFVDLMRVGYANALACVVMVVLHYQINNLPANKFVHLRAIDILGTYAVATMLMWLLRVTVKYVYDYSFRDRNLMPVFIYGVKEGGIGLAKSIRSDESGRFVLRGFISHLPDFQSHLLMGVRVYDVNEKLRDALEKKNVKAVLVSPARTEQFRNDSNLQRILTEMGVKIYMMPKTTEWNGQTTDSAQLKEVSIDDLLPRDEIHIDMKKLAEMLTGQRILITGSAGSIGSEMVRQIASFKPSEMMLIDQAETPQHDIRLMMQKKWPDIKAHTIVTSICKEQRMEDIFKTFRPDYVFHAAAYKHVPMMEDNPSESIQNNVQGTKILADLSVKYGVKKFVMISTDKAVNPTNVMGCSKRICEIYVQSLDRKLKLSPTAENSGKTTTQFVTTRFGNVLGSNGSVIPLFEKQIKAGGPVTVTDPNIIRYFMLIPEACKLVLEAGTMGNGGEIFVFDMGKPVRIADLAKRMILLSGAQNVEIVYSGLRPGEKLYEELLSTEENTKPSFHEKIRIANVREYDYEKVCKDIDELISVSMAYDDMATVKKMKEMVPEFVSNNSVYSELD